MQSDATIGACQSRQPNEDLARLAHRGSEVPEFTRRAARTIRRVVQFDGICMLTLDPAITADLVNPSRVNLFERWESRTAVKASRRRAPGNKQGAAMRSASMAEYDIADVRPLSRKGRA
jgi:quinol monooxygenase YgiN